MRERTFIDSVMGMIRPMPSNAKTAVLQDPRDDEGQLEIKRSLTILETHPTSRDQDDGLKRATSAIPSLTRRAVSLLAM